MLGRIVVQRPADQVDTLEGRLSLAEAVIREAVQLMRPEPALEVETAFARGLARDGYVVAFDEESRRPKLRAALPGELGLPAVDDEVHELPSTSTSRNRSVILIRGSRRMPGAIGRRQFPVSHLP